MRRRSATYWERWCCRSWLATAHITAVRGDGVNPGLLGMERVVSEDAVRRALKMPETDAEVWLRRHLDETTLPLLGVPWILDVDTTVKPLFGHQEGAVVGYNPHKPGRPSHTLHTYWVAGLRLVLDVEVKAGNEQAHSAPALWGLGWAAGRGCYAGMPSLGRSGS